MQAIGAEYSAVHKEQTALDRRDVACDFWSTPQSMPQKSCSAISNLAAQAAAD